MKTNLPERVITHLKERRKKLIEGGINCIPSPVRFLKGIEQGMYYLVSGSTKAGKTQLTNFVFLYNSILYAYRNKDKIRLKIFYYPLEESAESITTRFMCYLLYTINSIRIAPVDLQSINKEVDQDILDLLESDMYKGILDYFNEVVSFMPSENPTGMYKDLVTYANHSGVHHTKIEDIKGEKKEVFDYYSPNDPDEYVMIIVDHISLLHQESGKSLKETMDKLSEYMVILRNRYNYIPVIIQQQATSETQSLEAVKQHRVFPTVAGLADSKYTARDCNVMIGITNPYALKITSYCNYNIALLGNYSRFVEVVINRNGEANNVEALFFDGAVNYYHPLPKSNSPDMSKVYDKISSLSKNNNEEIMIT